MPVLPMRNTAPAIIHTLVKTFEKYLSEYHSSKNETELRREFLDKFFTALGWDVDNLQGAREAEKEVAHEYSVEIDGQQKKADYAFRLKRDSAAAEKFDFLVEAKKPSVKIETDVDAAFQIRRYGWSARIPINILTDFEHLAVYDCRVKPKYGEKAVLNRQALFHYKDYADKWDEIARLFSPAAIRAGSLSEYAKSIKGKRGTADVDADFLQEIERWRELLAKNIAANNSWIDIGGLNYAVQMIIDRIIFLRICEERSIEPENQLHGIANKAQIYKELCLLFKRADTKYNSGLFHFAEESAQASRADDLTLRLQIDAKPLRDIILNLYYPKSPYAFLYIPSDILGQVYERFLGKVIRLTDGHRAKVEDKPEVRKAGGVFYTPTFIVAYIVANTLGKLLPGLHPQAAAGLKIVDPACGSGTFLLGAFDYLLAWHLKWYADADNDPEKWVKNKVLAKVGNDYRLTPAKKKEILLNNIYGVDIDAQAVEVTKLSLLLKVLENASGQLELGMQRILPDLGNNIKCGNSLVGEDYFEGKLIVDNEERNRVNPFDWAAAFPEVFAQGGFDAVVGNPPYIRIQAMQEWASEQVEYFKQKYKAASKGNYDIYVVFVEKVLSLLNAKGKLGFILPHKFFNAQYGAPVRELISQGKHISKVVHFGDQQVFDGATTYTCLLFLNKQSQDELEFTKVSDLENWRAFQSQTSEVSPSFGASEVSGTINAASITAAEWNFSVGKGAGLFEKLSQMPVKLGDVVDRIYQGPITSADTVFLFKDFKDDNDKLIFVFSKENGDWIKLEKGVLRKVIRSGSIGRYWANTTAYVLFPYAITETGANLLTSKEFESKYPLAWTYLEKNKKLLENREKGAFKDMQWYRFGRNQNLAMWEKPKLLIPYMITDLSAYYDAGDNYYFINVTTGGYGITSDESKGSYFYLCGLLNSRLLNFVLKQVSTTFHGGYFAANKQYIEQLPIRTIDFNERAEKSAHDKIVALVESMLALHKSLALAQSPVEKERLEKQIKSTDEGIDKLVYDLYGLNQEEIRIVES